MKYILLAIVSALLMTGCLPEIKIPLSKQDTGDTLVIDSGETGDSDTDTAKPCPDADADGYTDAACGGDDCNDADAGTNPGASESCADLVDRNCDGNVIGIDADGDGYAACMDCDDSNGGSFPGNIEICDGVDNDCSGTIDGSDAVDATTWYADVDGDGYGDTAVSVVDCTAPAGYVEKDADCNDSDGAYNPGAAEADCTDPNDYNCDGSVGYTDADGDGYAACEECDDTSASIHPDATDACNGADDDCDGSFDEDVTFSEWYSDADGDGYGNIWLATATCDGAPLGYVASSDDCDDGSALTYPGAAETCTDAVDYNCDGSVGYTDADGDGWAACEECDDANAEANPDEVEVCDGGKVDEDCNGLIDDADPGVTDAATWFYDGDGDGYGDAAVAYSACEEPAGYVASGDDCDDVDVTAYPGAEEVCDTVDNDCDGAVDNGGVCDTGGDTGIVDTGDTSTVDTGDTGETADTGGTLEEITFGDGGTCSADPFTSGSGGAIPAAMIFSDGAGSCGVYLYGSGSSSGPSGTKELLAALATTSGVTYTVELDVENTVPTDVTVYANLGGLGVASFVIPAGTASTVSQTWTASAATSNLEIWSDAGTDYDAVLYSVTVTY